jgi:hypothetical protein
MVRPETLKPGTVYGRGRKPRNNPPNDLLHQAIERHTEINSI